MSKIVVACFVAQIQFEKITQSDFFVFLSYLANLGVLDDVAARREKKRMKNMSTFEPKFTYKFSFESAFFVSWTVEMFKIVMN